MDEAQATSVMSLADQHAVLTKLHTRWWSSQTGLRRDGGKVTRFHRTRIKPGRGRAHAPWSSKVEVSDPRRHTRFVVDRLRAGPPKVLYRQIYCARAKRK